MGITMRMLEETDTCFHGILPTSPAYSIGKVFLNVVFGKPDNFRKEKFELKMHGNNGTNITVYGSFSRSDNCDREFQKIAAKFGLRQEAVDLPSKSLARDDREDERVRRMKKKPDDLATEVTAVKTSAADGTAVIEENKSLVITAQNPGEIGEASKTVDAVDKLEDKENPPLV
ncbi:hypothetical protein QYE76_067449 [Lolium multiflorum]|uniref:Uncharacterized protein n=1 Tax=Lolium multiflorum TaxID=4521 RepID=A0AAD8SDB7_LOLMU|nr:hypothetical protein QYE76_067449 [Lolium multiflorum]